tara:strand:+ start:199 stop:390 length:192 start_codon:yes stop_codon:yes gene_type:complete
MLVFIAYDIWRLCAPPMEIDIVEEDKIMLSELQMERCSGCRYSAPYGQVRVPLVNVNRGHVAH